MSRVRRLSIRGIRNFSDESEETIRFTRPLTLIVGQNGVGKTTIIECLRYASTGEFPPGSDKGKSFIHDPMLKTVHSVRVRGNVKAEFLDKKGNIITVTRIMEATRNDAGLKFKTVDSTLSRKDKKTGEEFSLTHRCVDVNKEIKEVLGLSTAILNNVIFCHQDDANWPLEDSRKLKERLDEIFDTTRYNKALEQLRNIIRTKQAEVRLMNVEKRGLAVLVEEVKAKENRHSEYKARELESTERIRRLSERMQPVHERISELKILEEKYLQLKLEREKKEIELSLAKQQLEAAKAAIRKLFVGTDDELLNNIRSYDETLIEKKNRITEITRKLNELSRSESEITSKLSQHRIAVGTLRQQMSDHEVRVKKRNELLSEFLKQFEMTSLDDNPSEQSVKDKINSIQSNVSALEQSLAEMRVEQNKNETILEKKVEVLRGKRTQIDFQLRQTQKEVDETVEMIRESRQQIARQGDAEKKLKKVDSDIEEIKRQVEMILDAVKTECFEDKIDETMRELETLEEKYNEIEKLSTAIQNQSNLHAKMDTLKTELESKYLEVEEMTEKHGDKIKELLGITKITGRNLQDSVEEVQKAMTLRLKNLKEEMDKEQYKAMTIETKIKHATEQLNLKMSEIKCDKEKIHVHCQDYKNYNETSLIISNKMKALQKRIGMFSYQGTTYGEYIKTLSAPNPCCPLCKRGFSNCNDATHLITQLEHDLKPERLKQYQAELNNLQERHDALLSLKPCVESVVMFEESGKVKVLRTIKEDKEQLEKTRMNIKTLQDSMLDPEKKIAMCNSLSGDLALWDRNLTEIERIEEFFNRIELESSQIGIPAGKTVDDIKSDREKLQQQIKSKRDAINNLRASMDMQNNELRRCNEIKAKCLEEQLKAHNDLQKVKHLRETIETLLKREQSLNNTIQEWRRKSIPAQEELDAAERSLEEMKHKYREDLDNKHQQFMEYSKQLERLNSCHVDVTTFFAQKVEDRLKNVEEAMDNQQKTLDDNKTEKNICEREVIELQNSISFQETDKRNLTDNYELRQKESGVKKIISRHNIIKLEMENLNYNDVKEESELLEKKHQELERAINIAKGSKTELDYNIKQLEDELEREEYRTAREKYQDKWLEQIITEDAISDLQAYSKALDISLSDYHEERMNSVNATMRNLWNLIYTGNDTTSIQIRTEATTGTGARRIFNYKLVQIKHGAEMDMKGRCSAGQRVLASIVIRLALAETFCEQCGMLALDEPTTNLDACNAASLAQALHNYVRLRASYQKSFQLILITHDENFIHKLSDLNNTKSFYELYRNVGGFTSIRFLVHNDQPNKHQNSDRNNSDDDDDDNDGDDGGKVQGSEIILCEDDQPMPGTSTSAQTHRTQEPFKFGL